MNSYQDNTIQTKEERDSIKNSCNSLQDNSPTDSLYSPEYWDMEWDTKEESRFYRTSVLIEWSVSVRRLWQRNPKQVRRVIIQKKTTRDKLSEREQLETSFSEENN